MCVCYSGRFTGVQLQVDEIALAADAQLRKLELTLTSLNEILEINVEKAKWSVKRRPIKSAPVNYIYTYLWACAHPSPPSVSHSQQRPVGYVASSGRHGESFPAWSRSARERQRWGHPVWGDHEKNANFSYILTHSFFTL